MKAHKLFLMLFIICAFALTQTLTVRAQTTLNGTVNIITNAKADKVVSEGGRVYLSSVNINNSQINGDTITVTSRATIGGLKVNNGAKAYVSSIGLDGTNLNNVNYKSTVNVNGDIEVDEGRLLNVSSAVLSGLDVGGDTTLDLNATVHGDIEVGDGGTVLIGGVNIEGKEINSGVNVSSTATTAPVVGPAVNMDPSVTGEVTVPELTEGMTVLLQNDPRWKDIKLGNSNLTIGNYGCYITSLAMLTGKNPDEINRIVTAGGGFAPGGYLRNETAAKALGMKYKKRDKSWKPDKDTIAEVKVRYRNGKMGQHFVIWKTDGTIIDPLSGKATHSKYTPVSFREFTPA